MTRVWMLRHARTAWNAQGRIQGLADVPLDACGEAASRALRVPPALAGATVVCSPLRRARQTAANLDLPVSRIEVALREMDWGTWEGCTLAQLRARLGTAMQRNEARGLDFRPDGGESPREVQARLIDWLAALAADAQVLAVTHKGVIRAAMALACDWNMLGRAPLRLDWQCLHGFHLDADGRLGLDAPNTALRRRAEHGSGGEHG